MTVLRCEMCHRRLKGERFMIETLLRPGKSLVVGPECFRKEKKARAEMLKRFTPEQIEAMRAKAAALDEKNSPAVGEAAGTGDASPAAFSEGRR